MLRKVETGNYTISQIQKMIGGVMLLCQYSRLHKRYNVAEWQERIMPSIDLNQFCYYEDDQKRPVAFCNWAFLSEESQTEILSGERELCLSDWRSGNHIFIPEMIAPFGHARRIVTDLRRRVLVPWKGQKVSTVRGKVCEKTGHCTRYVQWFSI